MDSTFKFLGFGASVVICSLLAGCSNGDGNPDSSSGGSTSTGGAGSGTGGTSAGGASGSSKLFTFDMDEDGFKLSDVKGTPPYTNLVTPVVAPAPTLNWAAKDAGDDKNSGSLKITATYTFWNQSVAAEVPAPQDKNGVPVDFSHKTVTARVFIEPMGLSPNGFGDMPDAPGGVVFYMKSGTAYDWGQAAWLNATTYNAWFSVKFNTDNLDAGSKATFDPSNVIQMGLSFSSGGGGPTHCPDGQAGDPNNAAYMGTPTATCPAWPAPLATVVYIDNISVVAN